MSSKRSKQRPRKKKKKQKQTKFMSLNNHFVPPPSDQYAAAAEAEENDPQVACLLEDSNQPGCMPTITDLFAPSAASSSSVVMDEFPSPASPSVEWDGGDGLARRALKGRERWVFCRDVEIHHHQQQTGLLQLKLDYDEVITAWSGRAPPYIDGDGPQVVPELQQHHNILVEVGSGRGRRVQEIVAGLVALIEDLGDQIVSKAIRVDEGCGLGVAALEIWHFCSGIALDDHCRNPMS